RAAAHLLQTQPARAKQRDAPAEHLPLSYRRQLSNKGFVLWYILRRFRMIDLPKDSEMLLRSLLLVLFLLLTPLAAAQEPKDTSDVGVSSDLMDRKLQTIYKRHLKLSDFKSKIIVLNLFADWCGPCVSNLRDLRKLQKEQRGNVIQIVGLV